MEFDADRIRSLTTYRYDPGTASPSPKHHHLEAFRDKEFDDGHLAELFHENTKYTGNNHVSDTSSMALFVGDPTMQLVQRERRNDYPGYEAVELPEPDREFGPDRELGVDLATALGRRRSRRSYDGSPIGLAELSTLLALSLGVNRGGGAGTARAGRTYPSGGKLYPVEPYVAVTNGGPDLPEGLYYYAAEKHVLRVVEGDVTGTIDDAFQPPAELDPTDAAVCLLFTGAFWRTYAKYGPRGYRFVLQESGHAGQNVQLVADALGYGSVPIAAVHEDEVNDLLGVDGVDEALVYALFVGSPAESSGASGGPPDGGDSGDGDSEREPGETPAPSRGGGRDG